MYPVELPLTIWSSPSDQDDAQEQLRFVACNRERDFCAVSRDRTIALYFTFPPLCLCTLSQPENKATNGIGTYERLLWKPDSSALLASTSKDYLLLFKVSIDWESATQIFHQEPDLVKKRAANETRIARLIPKVQVALASTIHLPSQITCFVSLKEEFLVCLRNGTVHRFLWDGQVMADLCWTLAQIPFYYDQTLSRPQYVNSSSETTTGPTVYLIDICYSTFLGGFLAVLSNGRAALVTASSPRFHPTELRAIWVPLITDALCCSANHRYRLMAFGCESSAVAVYHVDDSTGAIVLTYQADLSTVGNPELTRDLGGVQYLDWSTIGSHLIVCWRSSAVACWSTFGSRLWFKLRLEPTGQTVFRFDWGREGHQVWMVTGTSLFLLRMLRACDYDCRPLEQHERIVLHTHDRLFLSPENGMASAQTPWPLSYWRQILVPAEYLSYCWPVRTCHFDAVQGIICVTGTRGFTYLTLSTKKWRLFGNETQERQFVVGCSVRCWRGYILCACYDFEAEVDQLRFYPCSGRLDNANCYRLAMEAAVLQLTVRGDVLLTFDIEAKCTLYELSVGGATDAAMAERRTVILVSDLVPHPFCVISVQMFTRSNLTTEPKFCTNNIDTVLLNIAGRLVMLTPQTMALKRAGTDEVKSSQLEVPLLIASFVEEIWCGRCGDSAKPHLQHAIWISSGSRGIHLWMPLILQAGQEAATSSQSKSFISKWIMLNFELKSVYPLVVCPLKCFFLGVESESADDCRLLIEYKREVFLHHILKQLLKRNLGVYAWDIATTCRDLTYFEHVLELLLHSVLEEEGTCADPIPNPLLPTVTEFLREFPEFLQVIAHCARKTEMALWNYLFQFTGSPRQLFQLCIKEKKLETAACYFIILQSTESTADSKKFATELLEAVLENCKWSIACEIIRFLSSIDPSDLDSPPITPLMLLKQSTQPRVSIISSAHGVDPSDPAFVFSTIGSRSRQHSSSATLVHADGPALSRLRSVSESSADAVAVNGTALPKPAEEGKASAGQQSGAGSFVQGILSNHASRLLSAYRLYDLAMFALQVHFRFILWLISERTGAAVVHRYPDAMERLMMDFQIAPADIASKLAIRPAAAAAVAAGKKRNKSSGRGDEGNAEAVVNKTTEQVVGQLNLELLEDPHFIRSASKEALLLFLQRVMLETACLDWLLLISLAVADLRVFRSALCRYVGPKSEYLDHCVQRRLKDGLQQLSSWAVENCAALVPLLKDAWDVLNQTTAEALARQNGAGGGTGPSPYSSKSPSSCSSSMSLASTANHHHQQQQQQMMACRSGRHAKAAAHFPLSGSLASSFSPQAHTQYQVDGDLVNPVSPTSAQDQCSLM